jgi:hypothetical protein
MVNNIKKLEDITIGNLRDGEVTVHQLNEIYKKIGFSFEINKGKFMGVKKEK